MADRRFASWITRYFGQSGDVARVVTFKDYDSDRAYARSDYHRIPSDSLWVCERTGRPDPPPNFIAQCDRALAEYRRQRKATA